MVNYNRTVSNERETQVLSHKMSTLVLFETQTFIKKLLVSVIIFYFSNKVKACTGTMWIHTCVRMASPRKILRQMVLSSAF